MEAGEFRRATDTEIESGQLPAGASLLRVITVGGDRSQKLLKTASKPEDVTVTAGTVNVTFGDDGSTTYTFGSGSSGGMNVVSRTGNVVHENKTYWSGYTVDYKVSSVTGSKTGVVCYRNASGTYLPVGGDTTSRTYYYGYQKSTLTVTGADTGSGSAILVFTPNAPSGGGGSIKYMPSVREVAEDQKFGYYTYTPGSGEPETRTFLVQGAAAVQNFAFDGMDDLEYELEV